ncbi:MAG TPA: DNA polymerase III subunit gamma/tau, partial [Bauldia sp.]|nr:DNA polymerase III subunit gamma/tau [Bauldia sp.]
PAPARAEPAVELATFADLVAFAGTKRELKLKHALEETVRLIRFEPGRIEVALTEHASPGFAGALSGKLEEWTGRRWMVVVARDPGPGEDAAQPTLVEARRSAHARLVDDARADPLVAAVLARFPGAEIVNVQVKGAEGDEPLSATPFDDVPPITEDPYEDEDD